MTTTPQALTIDELLDQIDQATENVRRGDVQAALQVVDLWRALDAHMSQAGALPARWDGSPVAVAAAEPDDGLFSIDFSAPAAPPEPAYAVTTGKRVTYDLDAFERIEDSMPLTAPAPAVQSRTGKPTRVAGGTLTSITGRVSDGQDTSKAAHRRAALSAGRRNHAIFWAVYDSGTGLADHEIESRLSMTHQSASSTRNALMNAGYLIDSGRRRSTPSGNDSIVWTVSDWAKQRINAGLERRASAA